MISTMCRSLISIGLLFSSLFIGACATTQGDWQKATQLNNRQAYLDFLEKNPNSEYVGQVIGILEKDATIQDSYTIPEFQALMEANPIPSKVRVTLRGVPGQIGRYEIEGNLEYSLDPTTRQTRSLTWSPGAQHTLLGALDIRGYKFLSDHRDHLVFRMEWQKGYVYQQGNGIVITPAGNLIRLARQGPGPTGSMGARFVDSGQGTILDSKLGLEWVPDQGGAMTWSEAKAYVSSLTFGGRDDWRLPTRTELQSLHDISSKATPRIDQIFRLTYCCVWTSEQADCFGGPTAWAFSFGGVGPFEGWFGCGKISDGGYYHRPLEGAGHVLAVRSRR